MPVVGVAFAALTRPRLQQGCPGSAFATRGNTNRFNQQGKVGKDPSVCPNRG